jgi:hypothetical protein
MEPYLIAGLVVVVAAIVISAALVSHKAEKQRTERIAQLASDMGFEFAPVAGTAFVTTLGDLPLFSKGHSQKTKNVMRKVVRGSQVTLLDYQYTVGAGKHRRTTKLTVAVFYPPDQNIFPEFEMHPESLWHKVGSYFGYQDIDFESHPVFSNAYLLRGSNEAAIRAEFTPEVLDFFEKEPVKWCVETRASRMAVFRPSRVKPEDLRQFLTDATRVFLVFATCPTPEVTEKSRTEK